MGLRLVKTFILGLLAVCLMTLLGIYYVWQHHRVVSLGGDLASSARQLDRLQTENELLEAEYRTLRSRADLAPRAFVDLGMKQPSSSEMIRVDPAQVGSVEVRQ